ncbi:MAG: DUF423 domain-containing protein [Bacteroidetes bacterium]|nr:DUF423 domain-containing protein [Bacteroidota bacterium]
MQKIIFTATAFSGFIAVGLGAFGAHALRSLVSADAIAIWEKGIQYQFYHTLALLFCCLYLRTQHVTIVRNAAICFILGIVCFSGSLYLLASRELSGIPTFIIGPVTPLGGIFFMCGWALLLFHFLQTTTVSEKNQS